MDTQSSSIICSPLLLQPDMYRATHGVELSFPAAACALCEHCSICCRPDGHFSRPFGSLSGGQQALATLALSFALQAAFPSPFYFFDEIDCALDTSNATRVADYIVSQKSAQYLLVSHKPQVNPLMGRVKSVQ